MPQSRFPVWLKGVFVGSFTYALTSDPEFLHVPLEQRREAAHEAQGRALTHWRVWCAIVGLFGSVIGFSFLEIWLGLAKSGTVGACIGFFLGVAFLQRSLYYQGLPYYRATLLRFEKQNAF